MFRSMCTICTDVLSQDLAACPCGHVYHNVCLNRWLSRDSQSKNCPTCRKKCNQGIKLFLSDLQECTADDVQTVQNKLRQQIAIVAEKECEIKDLKKENGNLNLKLKESDEVLQKINKQYNQECSVRDAFKKQVNFLTEDNKQLKQHVMELENVQKEILKYERIKTMITGSHEEAEDMLKKIGTGPKTVHELASQLTIMKRENEKMREAKQKARSEKDKLEKENNLLLHELKTSEVKICEYRKQSEQLQEQLKDAEKEKESVKKKLEKIQRSFQSPSPRNSIINRLLQESPAPLHLSQPVLTCDNDKYLEFTDDSENKKCHVKYQKTTKTVSFSSPKTPNNIVSPVHPGEQNNRKRPYDRTCQSGRIRQGFNGLGGHTTVLMPAQLPHRAKKKVSKPVKISKFVRSAKDPPLPQM